MNVKLDSQLLIELSSHPVPIRLEATTDQDSVWTIHSSDSFESASHILARLLDIPFLVHHPDKDRYISRKILRERHWEFAESHLLATQIRPGDVVADIGANIGYYTVLLGRITGKTGCVYSFEPEPANFQVLQSNVSLASQRVPNFSPVVMVQAAVADQPGSARLHTFEQNLGFHSLRSELAASSSGHIEVPVHTLDELRWGKNQEAALINRRIDVIKADIQGAESRLIAGAKRTVTEDRPKLCLELEPYISGKESCRHLLEQLRVLGYSRLRVFHANATNPLQILSEVSRVRTTEEVFGMLDRGEIHAYGTLWTVPDERRE